MTAARPLACWGHSPFGTAARWYAVTTSCRILHTLDSGQVTSKKAALLWALNHLDGRWSALIQQVLGDRPLGRDGGRPPREGSVGPTLALAQYAVAVAAGVPDPDLA